MADLTRTARAGGRLYWRRVRERERVISSVPEEHRSELDYDRDNIMEAVDAMRPEWRDLVNVHGFTPVVKVLRETGDLERAKNILDRRHQMRQQQLAEGHF